MLFLEFLDEHCMMAKHKCIFISLGIPVRYVTLLAKIPERFSLDISMPSI